MPMPPLKRVLASSKCQRALFHEPEHGDHQRIGYMIVLRHLLLNVARFRAASTKISGLPPKPPSVPTSGTSTGFSREVAVKLCKAKQVVTGSEPLPRVGQHIIGIVGHVGLGKQERLFHKLRLERLEEGHDALITIHSTCRLATCAHVYGHLIISRSLSYKYGEVLLFTHE